MFLSLLTLAIALSLSAIAAFYSIAGLAAIFAAAVVPIMIMGSVLEVAKLVVTVWLHEYWHRCRLTMKLYLVPAVGILMIITSMGIFGFLSKAHSDQSLVSGDVQAKIAVYDEKIKTAKDNIDANRKALKQMDEAVDQVMGRSTTETGADKSVALRRSQQKERGRLLAEIEAEQKKVSILAEQRAPIAAEVRKVEAEVGPIKYIAAFVYGDNPDANLLEKAVTWVIIIIVAVFDPLAIMMLLAATESLKWRKEDLEKTPAYEEDDGPLTEEQIAQLKKSVEAFGLPEGEVAVKTELFPKDPETSPVEILSIEPDTIPCVKCGIPLVDVPSIGFVCANPDCDPVEEEVQEEVQEDVEEDTIDENTNKHVKNKTPKFSSNKTPNFSSNRTPNFNSNKVPNRVPNRNQSDQFQQQRSKPSFGNGNKPLCNNGSACQRYAQGNCNYFHPNNVPVQIRPVQQQKSVPVPEQCRNGPECQRHAQGTCRFTHVEACRNGNACRRYAQGTCNFYHSPQNSGASAQMNSGASAHNRQQRVPFRPPVVPVKAKDSSSDKAAVLLSLSPEQRNQVLTLSPNERKLFLDALTN